MTTNPILETIKEREKEFDKLCEVTVDGKCKYWKPGSFGYNELDSDCSTDKFFPEQLKSFHTATLVAVLQAQVEMIRSMKKKAQWFEDNWFTAENAYPTYDKKEDLWITITAKDTYNLALDQTIAYIEETIEELTK